MKMEGIPIFRARRFAEPSNLRKNKRKPFLLTMTIQRIENEETGEIGTLVEPNMEAWEAWRAAQAEQPEEPELEQPVTWASMAAAIRKGVNEID